MKYPKYRDDGRPFLKLSSVQAEALASYRRKVSDGEYQYEKNSCLCGNTDDSLDVVVAEKDRYGLPCRNVLCKRCGIVRSDPMLDQASTIRFYNSEYRPLYAGSATGTEAFFTEQNGRGLKILNHVKRLTRFDEIHNVFEIGCGAGGILFPFHEAGKKAAGCDYGERYLEFGRSRGLQLSHGNIRESGIAPESQDLIILSHVMEHFTKPLIEIGEILEYLKPGGYLFVEVPGLLNIARVYGRPIAYFQSAHIFNFHKRFLEAFFQSFGLELRSGDEVSRFLCRKPEQGALLRPVAIWDDRLKGMSRRVFVSLLWNRLFYWLNPFWLRNRILGRNV